MLRGKKLYEEKKGKKSKVNAADVMGKVAKVTAVNPAGKLVKTAAKAGAAVARALKNKVAKSMAPLRRKKKPIEEGRRMPPKPIGRKRVLA